MFVRFGSTAARPPNSLGELQKLSMEHPDSLVKVTNLHKAVLQQSAAKAITSASIWVPTELAWRNDEHI